jgi:type VI secretion system secreted protein Hcp
MAIHLTELAVAAPPAASESDIFLEVQAKRAGKIKGEAGTEGHQDDIRVLAWHWGVSSASAVGSGAATSRRQYRPLVVSKAVDTASTGLLKALAGNDELKSVKLTMRKAGGSALPYFTMTLQAGRVIDVQVDVDDDGRAAERVTFAFTKIDVGYQPQKSDGSGGASYTFTDDVMSTS